MVKFRSEIKLLLSHQSDRNFTDYDTEKIKRTRNLGLLYGHISIGEPEPNTDDNEADNEAEKPAGKPGPDDGVQVGRVPEEALVAPKRRRIEAKEGRCG